jgi:hypothetical protein
MYELLRRIQNFRQSTLDRKNVNADRSLEDENLFLSPLLRNPKNTNMMGGLNVKFTFYFMEKTHKPLHLDKRSLVQWKITDMATSFYHYFL